MQAIKNFANRGGAIEIHFGGGGSHREFHDPAVHPLAVHATKIFEEHPIGEGRVQINLALDASTDRTECFVPRQRDWQSQPIVIDQTFTRSEVTNTTQERDKWSLSTILAAKDVQALQLSVCFGKQLIDH